MSSSKLLNQTAREPTVCLGREDESPFFNKGTKSNLVSVGTIFLSDHVFRGSLVARVIGIGVYSQFHLIKRSPMKKKMAEYHRRGAWRFL